MVLFLHLSNPLNRKNKANNKTQNISTNYPSSYLKLQENKDAITGCSTTEFVHFPLAVSTHKLDLNGGRQHANNDVDCAARDVTWYNVVICYISYL